MLSNHNSPEQQKNLNRAKLNPSPCQCQVNAQSFNPFMFRDNNYKSRILLSFYMITYIIKMHK